MKEIVYKCDGCNHSASENNTTGWFSVSTDMNGSIYIHKGAGDNSLHFCGVTCATKSIANKLGGNNDTERSS